MLFAGTDFSHQILTNFVFAAVLGVAMMVLSQKLRISAIVLLLLTGIAVGPEFLGWVQPAALGDGLRTIISLAVGIILFEGGLTLDAKGYVQSSQEITGILTKGVLVTWLVSAILIKVFFGFPVTFCLLSASLIIVTGPTVIGPLLKRIGVKKRLHHILHWEGVLIDPIGVFIALLCYEWILSEGGSFTYFNFISRFLIGAAIGLGFGSVIYFILKRNWVPNGSLNIFVLASAMLCFAASETLLSESGLLSVTVAGFLVGYKKPRQLESIIEYKDELKDFLIGLLFILLAAQLQISKFLAYGEKLLWLVVFVMFFVRPLNIFVSMRGSTLKLREKLFLSWIAPRGIVAASMASLFAFQLNANGSPNADFLETLTYSVIAGTVIFQGFTAKLMGYLLGVLEPAPKDWLIVGANRVGRQIGHFLRDQGVGVVLLDTNTREVKWALNEGFVARCENALTLDPENREIFYGIGNVLAITGNEDLNLLVSQRWGRILPNAKLFRWGTREAEQDGFEEEGTQVWSALPLKTILAEEQDHDFTRIQDLDPNDLDGQVLISAANGEIALNKLPKSKGEIDALVFQIPEKELKLPFRIEGLLLSKVKQLELLFGELAQLVAGLVPQLDAQALAEQLVAGEKEFSSLIGHGISLPHLYSEHVKQPVLAVAKLEEPVACLHTGAQIQLVFLLISPQEQPVAHLNMISRIAQLVMDPDVREALFAATDRQALYEALLRIKSKVQTAPAPTSP
ncbi:MAG: cation:proton antiporter [Acidobacteria bacterium]|nr:cation:proton antiporter [Acidobacteriota bacterium]MCB9396961.1 cation:proton antiporter [Acidobacteriota bacterium]